MKLIERITDVFGKRALPEITHVKEIIVRSDEEETEWFQGRDWRTLTWEQWSEHDSAISYFGPEAFVYYLPSILVLSFQRPDQWFRPADSLIFLLSRNSRPDLWSDQFKDRFLRLTRDELGCLKQWLSFWIGKETYDSSVDAGEVSRASEAVDFLEKQVKPR